MRIRLRRSRTPKPLVLPGGPIDETRTEQIQIPTGRVIFNVVVGRTLAIGPYTEVALWSTEPKLDDARHIGELVWNMVNTHVHVIAGNSDDGLVRAVVRAGSYCYFAQVRKSP